MRNLLKALIFFLLLKLLFAGDWSTGRAQNDGLKPVNLMIVLDNSCSMFPQGMIPVGCTSFGSDVNFLRIRGADLFLARLGFGQAEEADYRVGVISLGDEPKLISPLVPLTDARDYLASKIANPAPAKATRLVPALDLAYQMLRNSPNLKPGSQPAVVLITDGVPWPPEGQSDADIEKLISDNHDIPLFLMLLKGGDSNLEEFDQYVKFWQELQLRYDNVFVSLIENPDQIEDAYNRIVALLQDTIPSKANSLGPDSDMPFYVSKYTHQVVITIGYPTGAPKGTITVTDPKGADVHAGEDGVSIFRGKENPVEVISISPPRLAEDLVDQDWNIHTNQAVSIFIDREGVYRINFLSPETQVTGVNNVYLTNERQSPRQPFIVKFQLITSDGERVQDPQPIGVEALLPDSTQTQLATEQNIVPDQDGVYELTIDLPKIYPYVSSQFGRFLLLIHAGSADPQAETPIPIASSRLLVDVGPIPYIQFVNPAKITCSPGSSQKLLVSMGDYQSVTPESLKLTLTGAGNEAVATGEGGEFRVDLAPLCQVLLTNLACGEQKQSQFQLNVQATLQDGYQVAPIERVLPVIANVPDCTPTPKAVAQSTFQIKNATPTAKALPPLDSDNDQVPDSADKCPLIPGWRLFNGCPPPGWVWYAGFILLLVVSFITIRFLIPWIYVHFIARPPEGFILVCRHHSAPREILDLYKTGMRHRTRKIKIGGDKKKSHMFIAGLKPVEFVVEEKDGKIALADALRGETKAIFRQLTPEGVLTSDPEVKLWIASKRSALEKIAC